MICCRYFTRTRFRLATFVRFMFISTRDAKWIKQKFHTPYLAYCFRQNSFSSVLLSPVTCASRNFIAERKQLGSLLAAVAYYYPSLNRLVLRYDKFTIPSIVRFYLHIAKRNTNRIDVQASRRSIIMPAISLTKLTRTSYTTRSARGFFPTDFDRPLPVFVIARVRAICAHRESRISRRYKISRLNEYRVTASLTKLVRMPGFRLINSIYQRDALCLSFLIFSPRLSLSVSLFFISSFLSEHTGARANPISLVTGMRSTLAIAYGRNADGRRWKNARATTTSRS